MKNANDLLKSVSKEDTVKFKEDCSEIIKGKIFQQFSKKEK